MCTEKSYGGSNVEVGKKIIGSNVSLYKDKSKKSVESEGDMNGERVENYRKAGKIAKEVVSFARQFIKKDMKLLDIAEKIEGRIEELGGKCAFPVNLSINEIAAHYSPSYNDETLACGLLKVDVGVEIDGEIADTAFSLDLENNEENKKLIESAENALQNALEYVRKAKEIKIGEIGGRIYDSITKAGFSPVKNLSGHAVDSYMIHAGITIPNYDNGNEHVLEDGGYAVEPFSTSGVGMVGDGKKSEIYRFEGRAGVRDMMARKIMDFVQEEYKTKPFCSRWIVKKYGTRAVIALKFLEDAGVLHRYEELIEKSKKNVAQAEHTFIIFNGKVEVTTE